MTHQFCVSPVDVAATQHHSKGLLLSNFRVRNLHQQFFGLLVVAGGSFCLMQIKERTNTCMENAKLRQTIKIQYLSIIVIERVIIDKETTY